MWSPKASCDAHSGIAQEQVAQGAASDGEVEDSEQPGGEGAGL